MRTARLTLALCCCLIGLAGVAAVAGAPPPEQICGVCGPSVANDAEIHGATGHGTLDIYVDETGDSLWHARVPVDASAAERYRSNASALEAAVDDAWAWSHAAEGDVETVEPTLEGETVVVNYTVDDVAERGVGGTWYLDYFETGTSPTRYEVAAERVTIHTPDGTRIANRVSADEVDGNTATWTNDGSGFSDQTHIVYGPGGVLDAANGYATIVLDIGPPVLVRGLVLGLVPGGIIGLAGIVAGRTTFGRTVIDAVTGRLGLERPPIDTVALERAIAGVGTVGTIGLLVLGTVTTDQLLPPAAVALSSLGFGYALLGIAASRFGGRLETRGLIGLAVLATIGATGFTRVLAGAVAYPLPLLFGFATALFLPIGHAFERGRTPIGLLAVLALVPSAVIVVVYPTTPVGLWSLVLVPFVFLPWVAVVGLFGYPLALLGRRLAIGHD